MTEILEDTATGAYEEVVRIPSGVMNLVRQSYDSRDKVLDWMLAIGVAAAMAYAFRHQLLGFMFTTNGPNAGKTDLVPNQAASQAIGKTGQPVETIYTYNMPKARTTIADRVGPSSVRKPFNPGYGPQYAVEYEEEAAVAWPGDVSGAN
jgi:hypothetical protein